MLSVVVMSDFWAPMPDIAVSLSELSDIGWEPRVDVYICF